MASKIKSNEFIQVSVFLSPATKVASALTGKKVRHLPKEDWYVILKNETVTVGYDFEEGIRCNFANGIQIDEVLSFLQPLLKDVPEDMYDRIWFDVNERVKTEVGEGYRPLDSRMKQVFDENQFVISKYHAHLK